MDGPIYQVNFEWIILAIDAYGSSLHSFQERIKYYTSWDVVVAAIHIAFITNILTIGSDSQLNF